MNKIEYTKSPSATDIDFITKKINEETSEYRVCQPFAFFIRDNKVVIIAGVNGFILYGKIYTD
jgi:serine protease inhibitor